MSVMQPRNTDTLYQCKKDYAIEEENAITAKLGQYKMLTNDGRNIIVGSKVNKPRERECKQTVSATEIE